MSTYSEIVTAIDELIHAKVTGASDVSEFASKMMGSLNITMSVGITTLLELRKRYSELADQDSGESHYSSDMYIGGV